MVHQEQHQRKRTVLITGCSNGGMGSALAIELHNSGLHVIATARDISKMSDLTSFPDIKLLQLDITSDESMERCVSQVSELDILINNAGASYNMPITDISIPSAKKLFDLNVWGQIAITQVFLPLLLKSKSAMIVNHTSVGAGLTIPFQGVYNASKSAMSRVSETLRLELQPFNIFVVELKTGGVKTNVLENVRAHGGPKLPERSIYQSTRAEVEGMMSGEWAESSMSVTPEKWATEVVTDLLKNKTPPPIIWRGESVWSAWFASIAPFGWFDGITKKLTGLDRVAEVIRQSP